MDHKLTAIIVDDEELLIQTLRNILKQFCPQIDVIDVAHSAFEAKNKIEFYKPQLLFLDINMPIANGFELLQSIENKTFETIFITAYDQFAKEALKEKAIAYILKPILSEEVIKAVKRAIELIRSKPVKINQPLPDTHTQISKAQKIVVQHNNSYLFLDFDEVLWMEANLNYTKIHLTNGKIIMSAKQLKFYQDLLPNNVFFRIHKSYLINTGFIKEYVRDLKGPLVILTNEAKLRVAQPKQALFRKFMLENTLYKKNKM